MTMTMVRYVGLDVHKRVVQVCIVDHAGKVVYRARFALNRHTLKLFATKVLRPGDHVALEATTNCWAVADVLRPLVARVVVSNPMATKAIAQPHDPRAGRRLPERRAPSAAQALPR